MSTLHNLKNAILEFKNALEDNPPYDYRFLLELDEKEYPYYLKKIYKQNMGEKLNLKYPKKFSEKIQWLKLYDNVPIKAQLTDKILVRDFVKERIGEKYLKPVLWIGNYFDDIPFDTLPEKFIIKTNHGCKWHFTIRNKDIFLADRKLFETIRKRFNGWLLQTFFPYAGFELQYKSITPRLLIEELLINDKMTNPVEYEIYCFNGKPKIFQKIVYSTMHECSVYDEDYNQIDIKFKAEYTKIEEPADNNLKLAVELSKNLCKGFKLVRVDWMEYNGGLLFLEMTFSPFSGFYSFNDESWNVRLGSMLDLKERSC